ncbi:MAG TPA: methyltransferase domain-containing protein [Pyrinomonadaceae bacterium]
MNSLARLSTSARYRIRALGRRVGTPALSSFSEGVRTALSNVANELRISRIVKKSQRQFRQWQGQDNLKLNLGCGGDLKPGWINVDLWLDSPDPRPEGSEAIFINYDLRREIPLDAGSCEIIYSSHFFEHLDYNVGLRQLRECYRLLKPHGTFRISLPDFKGACRAYLNNDADYFKLVDTGVFLPEVEPGTLTLIDYINFAAYQSGEHKRMYDEEKVIVLLQKIGFSAVTVSSYDSTIDPPSPLRIDYSFYVQATK